jgi:predicted DNA-binding ribbon-helix-helix protein
VPCGCTATAPPSGWRPRTTLEEIAAKEQFSLSRFVAMLYDETIQRVGGVQNFTSFLRVTCMHYLRNEELHAQQVAARLISAAMPIATE